MKRVIDGCDNIQYEHLGITELPSVMSPFQVRVVELGELFYNDR
jgi:hypothetical protein